MNWKDLATSVRFVRSVRSVLIPGGATFAVLALLFALLITRDDDGIDPEVLGVQHTLLPPEAGSPSDEAPAVLGEAPPDQPDDTTAPAPPPTQAPAPTRSPRTTAPAQVRLVLEQTDNVATFVVDESGRGPSTSSKRSAGGDDPFIFEAYGAQQSGDVIRLSAVVTNTTARDISLPEGLVIRCRVEQNGNVQELVLSSSATRVVRARTSLEIRDLRPAPGPGTFQLTATLRVRYD